MDWIFLYFAFMPMLAIAGFWLLVFLFIKVSDAVKKSPKEKIKGLLRKILVSFAGIILICLCYQMFFRYEYKTYKEGSRVKVIKIDKLTGKSTYTIPEEEEKYDE